MQLNTPRRMVRRLAFSGGRGWRNLREWIRPYLPSHVPIAYKFALSITLLITLGMALLGMLIVSNQTSLLRAQMNEFGQAVVRQLAESSQELILSEDILSLRVVVNNLGSNEGVVGAAVYADDGEQLARAGHIPDDPVGRLYRRAERLRGTGHTVDDQWTQADGTRLAVVSFITPVRFQNVVAGHAVVTFARTAMAQSLRDSIRAIIAATVLMIVLAVITAFYIGRRLSQPIHDLMDVSEAIHKGDFHVPLGERRNDEIGRLMQAFNRMGKGLLEKSQVEAAFSRFVSTNVARQILQNLEEIKLGGQHVRGSVLFADIVGFTSMSEKLPPEEVAEFLNEYFSYISQVSSLYRGTIDKFMGDCAMVVFGVPDHDAEHPFNAIACAVLIQRVVKRLNTIRVGEGKFPVHFRIGVNSGGMLAGNMGAQDRMQYTVVGDTVNLAARLYDVAGPDQIIITEEVYKHPEVEWRVLARAHQSIRLRGKDKPVDTYIVKDVASTYRTAMDAQVAEILAERIVA